MGKIFLFAVFGIAVLGAVFWWNREEVLAPATDMAQQYTDEPTATINGNALQLEVVRTPEEQSRGLSGRASLPENAGMLFAYEQPVTPGFWMPDMNFGLDIIWIDENNRIVGISENVMPESYPQIFSPLLPVQYVIEVNAGWAKYHGITAGDEVIFDFSR